MGGRGPLRIFGWASVVFCALAALALGWWGFHTAASAYSPTDSFYLALQLFTLESGSAVADPGWQLQVARLLAPATTAYAAVAALFSLIGERARDLRLKSLKNHVVLAGLGREGLELAKGFRRRKQQVVAIELDEDSPQIPTAKSLGIPVLAGDAAEPALLAKARARRAAYLVCVTHEDGRNLDIAKAARELAEKERRGAGVNGALSCLVRLTDLRLCEMIRHDTFLHGPQDRSRMKIFNTYENTARLLWDQHPLDWRPLSPDDPRRVHLIVVGFDHLGESVMLQAIRVGHFANRNRMKVTVIDPEVSRKERSFRSRYPLLDQAAECEFLAESLDDPETLRQVRAWVADESRLCTVAFCLDQEARDVSLAMTLHDALRGMPAQIVVWLDNEVGMAKVLESHADGAGRLFAGFGTVEDALDLELILSEKLDALARVIHDGYLATSRKEGKKLGEKPALRPWDDLEPYYQDANRQQAHHAAVKARAVGARVVDLAPGEKPEEDFFSAAEIEMLAEMEHRRWMACENLAGWRLGHRDEAAKLNENLVPWDQLSETIKDYDRDPARSMTKYLAMTGKKLVRA